MGEIQMPTRWLTGSRIREKRLDRGLKQAAVAEAVGISPSYLNLIEHNRRRIGGKLLGDLARMLGVEASLLTEGANSEMLDEMRSAAALLGEKEVEVARAEEMAARYPGWSALVAMQHRRLGKLQEQVRVLTDRMAYDPQLAGSLHEVISAVTAIRSSSSILVGPERLDADWQRRFHQNIHNDSLRLVASSEALIAYLEAPEAEFDHASSPFEQVEAYLTQIGHHITALEGDPPDVAGVVEGSGLAGGAAKLLHTIALRYAKDAAALPLDAFQKACGDHAYDPAALAALFSVGFDVVLRRLAALPANAGHPPMGLAVCDAAGALLFLKTVPGFSLPKSGGACPLWPLFSAMCRPAQPMRLDVVMPGSNPIRHLCYAIATAVTAPQFNVPPAMQSTMLVLLDPPETITPPLPVGVSCRICPRDRCASRREPAILGVMPETPL
ncbi:MAG: putative transcriptional regulator/transcriptional regulator with XRE-family HTH domain [Yoonia sp.]